jgi:hypothetical protein
VREAVVMVGARALSTKNSFETPPLRQHADKLRPKRVSGIRTLEFPRLAFASLYITLIDLDSSSSFSESILLPYLVALKAINPFHFKKTIKCAISRNACYVDNVAAEFKIFCYDIQDWADPHKTLYPFQNHNVLSYMASHILSA